MVFAGDGNIEGPRYTSVRQDYGGVPVYRIKLAPQDYQAEHVNFYHPEVDQQFRKVCDDFRPDLVHAHNLIGLSLGLLDIARARGVPTVMTLHDHWGFCHKNTLIKNPNEICRDYSRCAECQPSFVAGNAEDLPIELRLSYLALQMGTVDAFISPSDYLADEYIKAGVPAARMNRIWYGIDVDRFSRVQKIPSRRVRFTFMGYLGTHKGLLPLMDALSLIPRRYQFTLNIAGTGELEHAVKQRVAALGLGKSVKFWGKVANSAIEEVLRHTDVQVLPSIWPENQPVSITEAMASRTPVIATRIGGIPELIEDGGNGFLVDPGNAAELADRMIRFMENPELIERFGLHGFSRIAKKTTAAQVARIAQVYESLPAPLEKSRNPKHLILCAGSWSDQIGTAVIEEIVSDPQERKRYQFVLADWLGRERFHEGRLLWITGRDWSWDAIHDALACGVPLLVPESESVLRELCRRDRCGLYYETSAEAVESMRYLFGTEQVLEHLSANAKRSRFAVSRRPGIPLDSPPPAFLGADSTGRECL